MSIYASEGARYVQIVIAMLGKKGYINENNIRTAMLYTLLIKGIKIFIYKLLV